MSTATKRKHVILEVLEDLSPPTENQQIVKVVNSRGNNLHEVEDGKDGSTFLVSMPNKFRKNVWIKRGDFVMVEPIDEGDKVKAEIVKILTKEHIKYFKKEKLFPDRFSNDDRDKVSDDLFENRNRPVVSEDIDMDSSDDSDEDSTSGDTDDDTGTE